MSRLNDFRVKIAVDTRLDARPIFKNMLILDLGVDKPYKTYRDLPAVMLDYADTTDTYKMATDLFAQRPAPNQLVIAGIDNTDLTTGEADLIEGLNMLAGEDWIAFCCTDNSNATIATLSTWAANNNHFYAATTQDLTLFTTINDDNTLLQYHNVAKTHLAEALMVHMLVRPIGSATAKFKRLANIPECTITDEDLNTLHSKHGGTYIKDMGSLQTTNSKTQGGEFLDVGLGRAWIQLTMEKGLRDLALSVDKIAFSNSGIASLVSIAERTLKQAAQNGIILLDESGNAVYSIQSTRREDVPKADRAARIYNSIYWTAELAGGIEGAVISGTLTI